MGQTESNMDNYDPNERYEVQVWFATNAGYVPKGRFPTMAAADAEARAYVSDAQGVRVMDTCNGSLSWVKAERRAT